MLRRKVSIGSPAYISCQIISRALADTDKTATTVVYTAIVGSALLTLPLPWVWITPDREQLVILLGIALLAGVAEVCVIKALEVIGAAVIISTGLYTLRREYLLSQGRV